MSRTEPPGDTADESAQPFAGVLVIEFGQFVAVPFCAQLLAEGGAHVIKIEALEGDPTRRQMQIAPNETRTFLSRNRGKRSLPLNLRSPAARPVIDALLRQADVALMNFRPGLAEELGLDAATLNARLPRLVVGTVTPFGSEGPDAGFAGMDIVVQARSGLMAANGRVIDGRPAPGDPVSADYMCAMSLAFGVASALLRRERTGRGGAVDMSLMQAAMTLANNQFIRSEDQDRPAHEAALSRLEEQRAAHVSFAEQRAQIPGGRAMRGPMVYFRTYETADAVVAIACGSHRLREAFMEAVRLSDLALTHGGEDEWTEHYRSLRDQVEDRMRTKTSAEWTRILNDVGVPVSAVKFPVELFDDPQTQANSMFHTMRHPTAGAITVLSPPVKLDGDGFAPAAPTATFGSESDAILTELGFTPAQIQTLVDEHVTHRG